MSNDEYQVFFKGWQPASSTHLPRSDFLTLWKNSLFIEYRNLRLSVITSCHSELNEHKWIESIANTELLCFLFCIHYLLEVHGEWHLMQLLKSVQIGESPLCTDTTFYPVLRVQIPHLFFHFLTERNSRSLLHSFISAVQMTLLSQSLSFLNGNL